VAEKCHYVTNQPSPSSKSNDSLRKRKLEAEDEPDRNEALLGDVTGNETAFKAMGYMPSSLVFNLSRPVEVYGLASPN
jgi:hypothetical protein